MSYGVRYSFEDFPLIIEHFAPYTELEYIDSLPFFPYRRGVVADQAHLTVVVPQLHTHAQISGSEFIRPLARLGLIAQRTDIQVPGRRQRRGDSLRKRVRTCTYGLSIAPHHHTALDPISSTH